MFNSSVLLAGRRKCFLVVGILSALGIGLFLLLNSHYNLGYSTSGNALASSSSSHQGNIPVVSNTLTSNALPKNSGNLLADSMLSLQLNIELRWRFDDIIHIHKEAQQTVIELLDSLAEELLLTTQGRGYLVDLFGRYKSYKISLESLKQDGPIIDQNIDIEESWAFINLAHEQQLKYFSAEEVDAFFAKDNVYDKQALARLAIRRDQSLSAEGKKILLLHQINQMDEEDRQVYLPSLEATDIVEYIVGSSESRFASTVKVNERVEKIKQDKNEWILRVNNYQIFQDSNKNNGLTLEQEKEEISTYLSDNFTSNELKRLSVFIENPALFKNQ